ncbi:ATP-binding protein [Nocardioides sp.]|uniref:sensor histidine kinase n=1 Tax=Nocardioides sp. TaxID=35761 RepID=UPI0035145316
MPPVVHRPQPWPALRRWAAEAPVARQVIMLQVGVVVALVAIAIVLAGLDARRDARDQATARALVVARAVADSPTVREAVATPDPSPRLQPYAEQVRRDTGTDFVVVMGLDRVRFTHPTPARIGQRFVGDVGAAPRGGVLTQEYTGTLGPSVRAVVPVRGEDAEQPPVALVAVGIAVRDIDAQLRRDVLTVLGFAAGVLGLGLLGTAAIGRRLRRATHGLGERELTRMYEYYSAVLHSVREGLLLLDGDGRVQLVNDEARRLLDLPDRVVGRAIGELGLAPALVDAVRGATAESDEIFLSGDRVLVVSSAPARWDGRDVGAVVTLRDRTELQEVSGELEVVRRLSESLRAQNHESANRLHTVVSLVELGRHEQAVEFATAELEVAQGLTDAVVGAVEEPVVAALLLGKSAEAAEQGIRLRVEGALESSPLPPRELVTVLGNLVDNAFEALGEEPGRREVLVRLGDGSDETSASGRTLLTVDDSGPGLDDDAARHAFERGWTTKAAPGSGRGLGLALVAQTARRHGGEVRVAGSPLGGASLSVVLPHAQEEGP